MRLNKGEWSELFVGLIGLDRGELNLYNSKTKIKIKSISYNGEDFFSKSELNKIDLAKLEKKLLSGKGTFSLSPEIVEKISFKKGTSKNKTDIILKYILENKDLIDGFGIKSSIAGKPSLLNASQATNFRFKIHNHSGFLLKDKAKKLVEKLDSKNIEFLNCISETFLNNLKMIDTGLPEILSKILVTYFQRKANSISELVEKTFLDIEEKRIVKNRVKDFLYYTCVGMFPTKKWDGKEEIIGTLVYTKDKNLFCLHRIDINNFKNYLYQNSVLDTASTTRHKFGFLFKQGDQKLLDLNLLIRIN